MAVATAQRPDAAAGIEELERKAADAAGLLKLMANEKRLLILCRLAQTRELSVGALSEAVGLGQSALSQHLAMLREQGVLGTRRDAQTVYYHLANPAAIRLLGLLRDIYCP